MKKSNTHLMSLINSGPDAFTNLFKVTITDSLASDSIRQGMTLRIKNFTPPTFTRAISQVSYQTAFHDEPVADYVGAKQFTLTFRLDEYYDIYTYLLSRKGKVVNPSTSAVPGEIDNGMIITVQAYIESPSSEIGNVETYKDMWKYEYCWVQDVRLSDYNYQSNVPVTVSATINFWKWQDPEDLQ